MAYPDLTANAEFIQCAHVSSGSNLIPTRVVIHCTISKTQVGGARATANGFANPASGGSAHYCIDPGTVVQSAKESQICWHAPPNGKSLGIEMTDLCVWQSYPSANAGQLDSRFANNEAAFHARWSRPEWQQMLARTALVTRQLCDKYTIPLVRISPAQLKAGAKGICGHRDVSFAFGQTDHIDPFACDNCSGDFPWDQFMDLVRNPEKAVAIMGGTVDEGDDVGTVDAFSPAAQQWLKDNIGPGTRILEAGNMPMWALALADYNQGKDDASVTDLVNTLRSPEFNQDAVAQKVADKISALLPTEVSVDAEQLKQALHEALVEQVQVTGTLTVQPKDAPQSPANETGDATPTTGHSQARAAAGVPDEETSPGVHGAFDRESLEG